MTKSKGIRDPGWRKQTPTASEERRWQRRKATLEHFSRLREMESIRVPETSTRSIPVPAPAPQPQASVRRQQHTVRPLHPSEASGKCQICGNPLRTKRPFLNLLVDGEFKVHQICLLTKLIHDYRGNLALAASDYGISLYSLQKRAMNMQRVRL